MSEPDRLRITLEETLVRLGLPDPVLAVTLLEEWEEVAGEPWAGRSEPVQLSEGELVVQVRDGSTASLLRYASGDLLRRLGERFGEGRVTSVKVQVGRPRKP